MFTASEVSARTGVLAVTLRQWERRYGFPAPARSASGYRLYSHRDIAQIEMMQAYLRSGVAASRAAALTVQRGGRRGWPDPCCSPRWKNVRRPVRPGRRACCTP